jgi:alanine dehydrogenase
MKIGVPKEIKKHEYRVGLTPNHAVKYIENNHEVYIQKGAGLGSGFTDEEYIKIGARILETIEDIYQVADMIIKVKEPLEQEFNLMKEKQIMFTFLHLAAFKQLTEVMLKRKVIGIAYETIEDERGRLPCLKPSSEVAGRLSVQEGAKYLEKNYGGRGVLLGGTDTVKPGTVVVIGANGVAGFNATTIALGMKAKVIAIDIKFDNLIDLKKQHQSQLELVDSNEENIKKAVTNADLIISTILITGDAAPKIIKREYLKDMLEGAVFVDISIDQGGSADTSKMTYHDNPIYEVDGIIHYCVGNMPGAVPRTASLALANATLPYGLNIANLGYKQAMKLNNGLAKGLNTYEGNVTLKPVAKLFDLPYLSIEEIIE